MNKNVIKDKPTKENYELEDFGNVIAKHDDGTPFMAYKNGKKDKINSYLTGGDGDVVALMELECPEMTSEFKRLQKEQYELFCRKQYNYGKGNIMLGGDIEKKEDRKMSLSGVVIRMNDKLNRLMSLILKSREDVVDESVEDTFIDMANYSIIALLVNRMKWK